MKKQALASAVTAVLAMAFAGPALAGRIVVDNDFADCPNADTNSIELGVELASPGDTVFVCRGIYNEQVTMEPDDSNIHVRGQDVDDVIVDGQNTMAAGFHLDGVTGVVVERFTVRRYHDDIVLNGSGDNVIRRNITTLAWGHDGITLQNSHGNLVEHNVSFLNQNSIACGISVGAGSSNNVVRHNLVFNNSNVGILVGFPPALGGPAGAGNVITHNVSRDNGKPVPAASGGTGVLNNNTPGTVIAHNDVRNNNANGILLTGASSTDVLVAHNEVVNNGSTPAHDGIQLAAGTHDNDVSHNFTSLNAHNGIHLVSSVGNVVEHNRNDANGKFANGCGIDLTGTGTTGNVVRFNHSVRHVRAGYRVHQGAHDNVLSHNQARDNPGDGIVLGEAQNNTVERNHAMFNGRDGIRAGMFAVANLFVENHMLHNGEHDAHDDNRAANVWVGNHCRTDFPPGTIC